MKKDAAAHRTLELSSIFSTASKEVKSRAWEHFGLPANESGQIVSEDIAVCKLCRSPVSAKCGKATPIYLVISGFIIH
ncbi:hypothetical protein TNCV_4109741 [Trichonephila clavipes]|nr:hypothetical protein TNCV_4109741 [Trichonephila clavipes]